MTHVFSLGYRGAGPKASAVSSPKPKAKATAFKKAAPKAKAPVLKPASPASAEKPTMAAGEPKPAPEVPPVSTSAVSVSSDEKMRQATELMKAGKVEEGLNILEAMTHEESVDPRVYLYRGIALKRLGKKKEALASFKKTVSGSAPGSNVRATAQKYLDELTGSKIAP